MNSLKFWSTFHINWITLLLVEFEGRKLWTREPECLKQGRPHRTPHCFDGLEGWELLKESEPAQHSGIHHQSWRSEKHFSFWNTWYEIIGNIPYKKYKFSRKRFLTFYQLHKTLWSGSITINLKCINSKLDALRS
jgi:hypothetical protein